MTTPATPPDDPGPAGTPPAAPEPGDESAAPPPPPPPPPPSMQSRRLTRSRTERWFGGVAGGLADYWDTDPTLIRVGIAALAFISGGLAIAGYFVLWLIIPEEDGASVVERHGPDQPRHGRRHRDGSMGGIVWGLLLIAGGLAFLLAQLDLDVDFPPWEVGLSVALILVGLVIAVEARRRVAGGLIVLAVLLTGILGAGDLTNFDAEIDGGFGDRQERITSPAQLEDSYSHAFGSMTIDLRGLAPDPGVTHVEVDIAFGSLELRLPEGIPYRIDVDGAFSSVEGGALESGGIAIDRSYESPGYAAAERKVEVDLSVVFGSAEVYP